MTQDRLDAERAAAEAAARAGALALARLVRDKKLLPPAWWGWTKGV